MNVQSKSISFQREALGELSGRHAMLYVRALLSLATR